jgi:hypothetical protein
MRYFVLDRSREKDTIKKKKAGTYWSERSIFIRIRFICWLLKRQYHDEGGIQMDICALPVGRMRRCCGLVLGMLALGSLTLSAQVLHPETVNFNPLKNGFSFTANASFGYFHHAYPVVGAELDSRVLFKDAEHIFGLLASFNYKLSGNTNARNDGVADVRYYYRFLDILYGEAFVGGFYNEPRQIDYLLFSGGGLIMPIKIIPEFTVNIGACGGYAWFSADPEYLSSPGILASIALFIDPIENLQFTLFSYLQMLLPSVVYCTVPVKAAVDIKLTELIGVGILYTFEWDVLTNTNPFTHDVNAFIRVKI